MQGNDGDAERSKSHWRSIGQESEACCFKGLKAQSDQKCSADRDRCAEARHSLKECAKGEGNKNELQTAIGSDPKEEFLKQNESSSASREVVHEEDREDDPTDWKQTVGCAVATSEKRHRRRHPKDKDCDSQCGAHARERGDMTLQPKSSHQD